MKTPLIPALCVAAVLTACGGGDDVAPPAVTSEVPASASQSVPGFIDYLKALVASAAEILEPVDVSAVVPPTDDTGEPSVVD